VFSSGGSVFSSGPTPLKSSSRSVGSGSWNVEEDPQKKFLRDKFMKRCFQRVAESRARAIGRRRYAAERSSDGFDMDENMEDEDDDDEEDEEGIMQDEVRLLFLLFLMKRIYAH
jgi:hypothetical protein